MLDNKIHYNQPILPVGSAGETAKTQRQVSTGASFQQVFQQELTGVKFSQHAQQRLQTRNIQLSSQELQKINAGLEKVAQKGAKESLFVIGDLALVVNVANKTVITALDGKNMKDHVVTNLDSAIIL
jgi:flagellar operon protein